VNIQGGLTGLVIGSPKTGKSAFLGSIAEVEGVESPLLLTARPREVRSYKYREHAIPYEIFPDQGWHPIIDEWNATDYKKLHRRVVELYKDEKYDAILFDPFTDVATLLRNHILMVLKKETVDDLEGKGGKDFFLRFLEG